MKNIIYALFAIAILFTYSCKDTAIHSPLIGKWRVVGYSSSSGGPQVYTPVDKGTNQYVQFNENGMYRSSVNKYYASYSIQDHKTITITYDDSAPDYYTNYKYKTYYLSYGFRNDTLLMSPAGPVVCIEGCSTRYVRY